MTDSRADEKGPRERGGERRGRRANPALWVLPLVALTMALAILPTLNGGGTTELEVQSLGDPVSPSLMSALSGVPTSTWSAAGASGVMPPNAVPPTDTGDPVQVLYIGAEFCPYCASERWPLIQALTRFGTFQGLRLSASASDDVFPNTPTFTFVGSGYESPYVSFEAVETAGRERLDGHYAPLQAPTPTQGRLMAKYDAPPFVEERLEGSIPFLLIGQRYLWVGSSVDPRALAGRSWEEIARSLAADEAGARAIVANANMITAAICELDGGRPTEVCTNPGVQAAARLLPPAR